MAWIQQLEETAASLFAEKQREAAKLGKVEDARRLQHREPAEKERIKMTTPDTFNGAKNAFTFYGGYLNTVAQEIGMERALAVHTSMLETMGTIQGKMIREQGVVGEVDAKQAYSLVKSVPESLGLAFEVLEESPKKVRWTCQRCSAYEGWQTAGLDANTLEAMCRAGSIRLMDTAVKQLNPKLSYQLARYRTGRGGYCEEQIVMG